MSAFVAHSFKDACEFLVCYLVDQAYGTTNTRAADQMVATGRDGDEFATVRIMSSDSDFGSSFKSFLGVPVDVVDGGSASTGGSSSVGSGGAGGAYDGVTGGEGAVLYTQVTETIENLYTFTTSIQFFRHASPVNDATGVAQFGLGAFDKAARLAARLSGQRMLDLMESMNIGLEDSSPARNVSALVNGGYYEDRGSVDMTFTIPNSETELLYTFATAGITLQVAFPGRPQPDTATINVVRAA